MIHLLFSVVAAEVAVVVLLLYKIPLLRKLATMGLDRLKRGRGPLVVKTVAGTFLVLLASNVYSMASIGDRTEELGSLSPTDQVLMSRHLLESSLIGAYAWGILYTEIGSAWFVPRHRRFVGHAEALLAKDDVFCL